MSRATAPIPLTPPPARLGGDGSDPHVVLVEPLIPPNTGNVARLCAATGAWLHLVEPLGFDLDHRKLKRAGLDYWPDVRLSVYADFEALAARLHQPSAVFFSKLAERTYTDVDYGDGPVLVFGRETTGLDPTLRRRYRDRMARIPIRPAVRSLNLSNAVAIAVYEVMRRRAFRGL